MKNRGIILGGKTLSTLSRSLNLGHGSTWPGHMALKLNKHFIQEVLRNSPTKVLFVAGTNGKTTTTSLIKHILEQSGKTVLQNVSGANLLNGIASTILLHANNKGFLDADYALFEVDENALPLALKIVMPDAIILLNLFRDQLDRYGEVNSIAQKWVESLRQLPDEMKVIANADDPQIAYIGESLPHEVSYFGLDKAQATQKTHEHAVDSIYCPSCGNKLTYSSIFYSHLGIWNCTNCSFTHPKSTSQRTPQSVLTGTYNEYNIQAALAVAQYVGISQDEKERAIKSFMPAFGRQEKLLFQGKNVEIILAKNPTGFNESLKTVNENRGTHILLLLNDNVADGKDVSWIWDIDVNILSLRSTISVSGTRAYDLATRLKYEELPVAFVHEDIEIALNNALQKVGKDETLFILPTYTAMLQVRKLLTGKKIL